MKKITKSDYQKYLEKKHSAFNTSKDLLTNLISEELGKMPVSFQQLMLGEVNEVYDVTLENKQSVIVRISRSKDPRFMAEKWAIENVRKMGVPSPEVLAIISRELIDEKLTFCIETKLPGIPLRNIDGIGTEEIKNLVIQAGSTLANIHAVNLKSGFGGILSTGKGKLSTWKEYVYSVINNKDKIIDSARKIGLAKKLVDKSLFILSSNESKFKQEVSHLLHGDYSTKHILVEKNNITGIIDFENCKGGDPVWDFAWWSYFFADSYPITWLVEGYLNRTSLPENFSTKLVLYRIRLGLELIHYYESEKNISGIKHTKIKLVNDLDRYKNNETASN